MEAGMTIDDMCTSVTIVTVTWNAEKYIKMFLNSLDKSNYKGYVVFVDSGSEDKTVSTIQNYKLPKDIIVEIISLSENVGIAEGNNIGIKWSLSKNVDVVILINNDVEVVPNSLSQLAWEAKKRNAVTVPLMFYGDDKSRVWYGGGKYSPFRANGFHRHTIPTSEIIQVTFAPACCMAVPSSVFEQGIMMDPKYFMYFDDTDFCKQLNEAEIPIYLLSSYWLYHYVSSSSGGWNSTTTVYYYTRNYLYFAKKYSSGIYYLSFLLWFIATRSYRASQFLLRKQFKQIRALFQGISAYYKGEIGKRE